MHALRKQVFIISALLSSLSLLWTAGASAQGSTVSRTHNLGAYAGFTERNDADFTVGLEYAYRMQDQWSGGVIVEYTPDVVLGRDATLMLGTANFRPTNLPRLKLTGGAGVEFKSFGGGDDLRFRVGAGYDVITDLITVTPRIGIDFGDGGENLTLGVTLFYGL